MRVNRGIKLAEEKLAKLRECLRIMADGKPHSAAELAEMTGSVQMTVDKHVLLRGFAKMVGIGTTGKHKGSELYVIQPAGLALVNDNFAKGLNVQSMDEFIRNPPLADRTREKAQKKQK